MKLAADISYDASPDAVFAMLVDPEFQERKCVATGAVSHEVDIEQAGGGATITTRRTLPTDQIPDFVQKFVGPHLDVLQADHWGPAEADGSRRGTIVVEVKNAPIRLTGTLWLHADGGGSRVAVEGDLKASVPLVNGKVERAAEQPMRSAISVEERIGKEWLATRA